MTDKIFLASDHGGAILKDKLLNRLKDRNIEVLDLGPEVGTSVDYPDYAEKLCTSVKENKGSTSLNFRKLMSAKAFGVTAYYDSLISNWFNEIWLLRLS